MLDDRSTAARMAPNELAAPRRYTIAPNIHTSVLIRTLPHAVCSVHAEGNDDPRHCLRVHADGEGVVRFHVQPSSATQDVARLEVDCATQSHVIRYPLHLRVNVEPSRDMPAPPHEKPLAERHEALLRPALSFDEAMRLTDEQALARELPLRPNPDEVPKAFNAWLRCVAVPGYRIKPNLSLNPDVAHGKPKQPSGDHTAATFSNWCGFERLRSMRLTSALKTGAPLSEPYDWVMGTWNVPFVTSEPGGKTYSSMWVGLDGDGDTDLVQAGTGQEATNINLGSLRITLTNYYAWTEFLPQEPNERVISNFTINPGDEIFTEVSVVGNDGALPLAGAFGRFFMMNLTTGAYASMAMPRTAANVNGREALWMMERPTVGGTLPDLANYNSAVMYNASARKANSPRNHGYVPYLSSDSTQDTMVNGDDTLSTVMAIDANSMRFEWRASS